MALEVLKTYGTEVLTSSDHNASNNHLLTYIKQNKDRILGDNAESTGVTAHDHKGTYGDVLGTDAIADSAVTTAKIADANVTTAKILDSNVTTAKIADNNVTTAKILNANVTTAKIADANVTEVKLESLLRYALRGYKVKCELVYQTSNLVTVTFPWSAPGDYVFSNITGIDVSLDVAGGGHVKNGVTPNEASKWYYLYLSNTYTLAHPAAANFLFTQSAAGESGYTLVGAVYNNAAQAIEPFDQYGQVVIWRDPVIVLNAGTSATYANIDCSAAVPANATLIKLVGFVIADADSSAGTAIHCYVTKNGISPAADNAQFLASITILNAGTISVSGSRDIISDSSQVIDYKVANTNAGNVAATIHVAGYHIR